MHATEDIPEGGWNAVSLCDLPVMQDAIIDQAKNKGNYESGIVNLHGMQSIKCISRELLHVDKTSGVLV